jgi:hypothetical protein
MGWEAKLEPTDLMPLIHTAWAQSLALSQANRQGLGELFFFFLLLQKISRGIALHNSFAKHTKNYDDRIILK